MRTLDALSRDVLRWQRTHDNATGERIMKIMLPTVTICTKQQTSALRTGALSTLNLRELDSIAWMAVFEAAAKYDPSRGAKFSYFANMQIKYAFAEFWRADGNRIVKQNRRTHKNIARTYSFHEMHAVTADSTDDMVPWEEMIADPHTDTATDVCNAYLASRLMKLLPNREKQVVLLRSEGKTNKEIAIQMGCSESRIYQLWNKAQLRAKRCFRAEECL